MHKKLISLLLALGLIMTLAGCANSQPKIDVALEEIYEKIDEEMELPPMIEVEGEYAEDAYSFDRDLTEDYLLYQAMINIRSDEIAIFKLKDQKDSGEIEKALENRIEQLDQIWSTYLPDQHNKVKNHLIEINGPYILFAISDDQEQVTEIFNSFFK